MLPGALTEYALFGGNAPASWNRSFSAALPREYAIDAPFVFDCDAVRVPKDHRMLTYWRDTRRFCALLSNATSRRFAVSWGDHSDFVVRVPTLVKSRVIGATGLAVVPLNTARHWTLPTTAHVPWAKKREEIVWRGATTGYGDLRRRFVDSLSAAGYDVRFDRVVQGRAEWARSAFTGASTLGRSLSLDEMLRYKYLLMLEGNDVATGLKWAMASNSVVVMPRPTKETWLFEGLLRPYVHYVPLDDPADAPGVLRWMRAHDAECANISANARKWVLAAWAASKSASALSPIVEYVAF